MACVPCPGSKIKSESGDDYDLCLDVCDGTTNVPNAQKTACGERVNRVAGPSSQTVLDNLGGSDLTKMFYVKMRISRCLA